MKLIDKYHQKYLPRSIIPVQRKPLSYYVSMLSRGTPFSFSRFGDGEWNAILDKPGENCDGHAFFSELGVDLRETLLHPLPYLYGMQVRAIQCMGKEMKSFLAKNSVSVRWQDADVFHYCNNAGTLFPLVEQLRKMKVVVVGPAHLKKMSDSILRYDGFIEIPLSNCYLDREDIFRRILEYYERSGSAAAVFAFSASMTTNVLIHRLYPVMGETSWLIDFGSLWDIYMGVKSRSGYEKEDWSGRIKKNLGSA